MVIFSTITGHLHLLTDTFCDRGVPIKHPPFELFGLEKTAGIHKNNLFLDGKVDLAILHNVSTLCRTLLSSAMQKCISSRVTYGTSVLKSSRYPVIYVQLLVLNKLLCSLLKLNNKVIV